MKDHENRVFEEQGQLDEKITKLSDFMHGKVYSNLKPVDQGLLMVQIRAMRLYSVVLSERIERFMG